ncbi:prephenate dehydrogenase [Mycolicibacterium arenosum]|uniref:Prephenate dehydrogenase n=1 Tax=Mycolicibacterium arenosum TaxID=2952157 RepID=A0ABT1LXG0_9MYCO|nr:prephenate dehydrogenase [Mycolicibacterium sp. CAU 1645]MCP9271573.1 prephenate dehydrogenase [Mycolicibacterium sp. CAU 1645]
MTESDIGRSDAESAALDSVAVIGTGMMGTSVALSLRARGLQVYLRDQDPAAAAVAAARGAGTTEDPPGPVDVAVIAVPPGEIALVLAECQAAGLARVFTDVGSVKAAPVAAAEAYGCDLSNYVGGHPMAGSERSGPMAASPTLFLDRTWVLTPLSETTPAAIETVVELVELTGAEPVMMTPADHDRAVARASHVPHLVAAALAATLDDADDAVLRLCDSDILDITRVAAGDAKMWSDVLSLNATDVAKVLSEVAADLAEAAAAVAGDWTQLTTLLRRGNSGRALLTGALFY